MIDTSEILVSKEHIDPLRDQGYVIYKLGRIDPVTAGKREAHMLWGNVKGGSGAAGKSAYEIAVLNGFVGTEAQWLVSLKGGDGYTPQKGIDYFDGDDGYTPYIQGGYWYVNGANTGIAATGATGKNTEMSVSGGYIVWRLVGDVNWINLISTASLKGDKGDPGSQPLQITGLTLLSAFWSLVSTLYEYNLANANITAAMVVDVIPENADIATVKAADIYPKTVSSAGSVKLYAKNAPTANIGVTIILTTATT